MFKFMRIHTVPTEEEGSTWLQLFFDLVYVAILVELGDRFSHNLHLEGLVSFVVILLPIWWSWLEFVDYGRLYPVDDIGQRILTVLYMAAMLLLAFEIHALTQTELTTFIVTYGLSKFISCSRRSGQTESIGTVHYMAPEVANGRYGKDAGHHRGRRAGHAIKRGNLGTWEAQLSPDEKNRKRRTG